MFNKERLHRASRVALIHMAGSALVALLAASIVFGLWYPSLYREIAGGFGLFLIVVGVDVVCGPLLTLVLFNPRKSRRELFLDLSLVVLIQLAALGYGLYSLALARPVAIAFEVDRFRIVAAADANSAGTDALARLKPSWFGPRMVGIRGPRNSQEKLKSIERSLQGEEPGSRPDWWQDYSLSVPDIMKRAQRIEVLEKLRPAEQNKIDIAVRKTGLSKQELLYLPIVTHKQLDWVAFINKDAQILALAPIDGF